MKFNLKIGIFAFVAIFLSGALQAETESKTYQLKYLLKCHGEKNKQLRKAFDRLNNPIAVVDYNYNQQTQLGNATLKTIVETDFGDTLHPLGIKGESGFISDGIKGSLALGGETYPIKQVLAVKEIASKNTTLKNQANSENPSSEAQSVGDVQKGVVISLENGCYLSNYRFE